MKHIWKKATTFVLATALLAGVASANTGTEGLFGGTGIAAYAEDDVKFSSASVTLADDLALNFYVDNVLPEDANDYTVNFTGDCVDKSSTLTYNVTEEKYYATTRIYAKDINKDITATLCNGDDEIETFEYSISKYLSSDAFSGADDKTSAIIVATKNFGNAAAEFFYGDDYGMTSTLANYTPDVSAYAPTFTRDDALLSLVLDSKTSARLYVKGDPTGTGNTTTSIKEEYPTYYEVPGLLPQDLAGEHTIAVDGVDYTFSALSWCNLVLTKYYADPASISIKYVNMAKAIVAYYKAAAYYADDIAPDENVVDLAKLTADYEAKDGDVLTGTLESNVKITVADDAYITLRGVNITNLPADEDVVYAEDASCPFAGITCDNDATIILEGENTVRGGYKNYPGIYIAPGKTLTINGTGSLDASSNGYGSGIGGGFSVSCGNIIINLDGTITAIGGFNAAGIGSGNGATCGNINIFGGKINAKGGSFAAGIGSGSMGICGDITITKGVTSVTATKGGMEHTRVLEQVFMAGAALLPLPPEQM